MKNLNTILTKYAKEDTKNFKSNGMLIMTNTKKGVLHGTYEKDLFTISWNMGGNTFCTPDEECVVEFLKENYTVEN